MQVVILSFLLVWDSGLPGSEPSIELITHQGHEMLTE
jgi:hypothetical protein